MFEFTLHFTSDFFVVLWKVSTCSMSVMTRTCFASTRCATIYWSALCLPLGVATITTKLALWAREISRPSNYSEWDCLSWRTRSTIRNCSRSHFVGNNFYPNFLNFGLINTIIRVSYLEKGKQLNYLLQLQHLLDYHAPSYQMSKTISIVVLCRKASHCVRYVKTTSW